MSKGCNNIPPWRLEAKILVDDSTGFLRSNRKQEHVSLDCKSSTFNTKNTEAKFQTEMCTSSKHTLYRSSKIETSYFIPETVVMELIGKYSIRGSPYEDFKDLFFKIETAFYDYLKRYVFKSRHLTKCSLFEFACNVYKLEPSLKDYFDDLSTCYKNWKKYKSSLPTYGAAILSEDASQVVMVQSAICDNLWGFPKGKVNHKEDPVSCAIREVIEEIGFDIRDRIRDDYFIEYQSFNGNKVNRLFIIENVPVNTRFTVQCKYEIKSIEWKAIDELTNSGGETQLGMSTKILIEKLKNVTKDIICGKFTRI